MKNAKVIFKGNSWLSKCINYEREKYQHFSDFDHQRTYDKSLSEKPFCAAVWCFGLSFCALCWFIFGEFILEMIK